MYSNLPYSVIESLESISGSIGLGSIGVTGGGYSRHGGLMNTSGSYNNSNSFQISKLSDSSNNNNINRDSNVDNIENDEDIEDDVNNLKNQEKEQKKNNIKTIKAAFPIYGAPMSFINNSGNKDGLIFEAWKQVLHKLKENGHEYDVNYTIIYEPVFNNLVDELKTRKYDVIIGDYGTNPSVLENVSYSTPFMSVKDVGVYLEDKDSHFEYKILRKVGGVLFWPFIGLILLSLISSVYAIVFSKKSNFAGAFVQMMNGILGDRGALMTGTQFTVKPGKTITVWFFSIVILLVSFAFLFYIQSVAISKSLDIISKNKDPFLFPDGKKILVPRGSTALTHLKTCCNIDTIEAKTKKANVEMLAKEFLDRKDKEKLDGFYHSGPEVSKFIKSNPQFIMSDTRFSVPSPVSFMISKYHPEILYEINRSIAEINWDGLLNPSCELFIDRLCFSSQY